LNLSFFVSVHKVLARKEMTQSVACAQKISLSIYTHRKSGMHSMNCLHVVKSYLFHPLTSAAKNAFEECNSPELLSRQ
ncbi:MAG: hypothetical protein KME27_27710, partial [Lyngbya sp. HA4199-MV5]|nr:hypothetical protein [Lyngbya sp. HA4199-MV5]